MFPLEFKKSQYIVLCFPAMPFKAEVFSCLLSSLVLDTGFLFLLAQRDFNKSNACPKRGRSVISEERSILLAHSCLQHQGVVLQATVPTMNNKPNLDYCMTAQYAPIDKLSVYLRSRNSPHVELPYLVFSPVCK